MEIHIHVYATDLIGLPTELASTSASTVALAASPSTTQHASPSLSPLPSPPSSSSSPPSTFANSGKRGAIGMTTTTGAAAPMIASPSSHRQRHCPISTHPASVVAAGAGLDAGEAGEPASGALTAEVSASTNTCVARLACAL